MIRLEINADEHRRIVYALQQQALRESTIALDLGAANVISPLYANLAEKVRQNFKPSLRCVMCDDEATEVGPGGPVCNDCAKLGRE